MLSVKIFAGAYMGLKEYLKLAWICLSGSRIFIGASQAKRETNGKNTYISVETNSVSRIMF